MGAENRALGKTGNSKCLGPLNPSLLPAGESVGQGDSRSQSHPSQPPSPTLPRAGLILPAPWGVTSIQDNVGGKTSSGLQVEGKLVGNRCASSHLGRLLKSVSAPEHPLQARDPKPGSPWASHGARVNSALYLGSSSM